MLSMVKCSVLLMARWANQVVEEVVRIQCSRALKGGNPQHLLSSLLLFYISFCISW